MAPHGPNILITGLRFSYSSSLYNGNQYRKAIADLAGFLHSRKRRVGVFV